MVQIVSILIALFLLMKTIGFLQSRNDKRTFRCCVYIIFSAYLIVYMYIAFFSRTMGSGGVLELRPFHVYRNLFEKTIDPWANPTTLIEKFMAGTMPITGLILNILLYIPLSYLLLNIAPTVKTKHVILIGFLCSIATETIQYNFKIGFCETDDVIHNTLGTAIGVWAWHLQSKRLNKSTRRKEHPHASQR